MSRINLLPWREQQRKQKQQDFFITAGIVGVFAAVIIGLVHFYHIQLINAQELRNDYLNSQITILDKKIKEIQELEKEKQRLLDRMRAIEELQRNRPLIVRFFDELINSLPEGVSVTQVTQSGKQITINGEAESNARVSSFMRNLESSAWLTNPDLDVIQARTAAGTRISQFTLRFQQIIPKSEEDEA